MFFWPFERERHLELSAKNIDYIIVIAVQYLDRLFYLLTFFLSLLIFLCDEM